MKEQIEEKHALSESIYMSGHGLDWKDSDDIAEQLYTEGYRKQKEGEWVFEFNLDGDDFYKCSVCGRQEVLNGLCNERNIAKHLPYCHCGAKMKGGAE